MNSLIGMMVGMWTAVGPGLLLVAALPVLVVFFGLFARTGLRRAEVARSGDEG